MMVMMGFLPLWWFLFYFKLVLCFLTQIDTLFVVNVCNIILHPNFVCKLFYKFFMLFLWFFLWLLKPILSSSMCPFVNYKRITCIPDTSSACDLLPFPCLFSSVLHPVLSVLPYHPCAALPLQHHAEKGNISFYTEELFCTLWKSYGFPLKHKQR